MWRQGEVPREFKDGRKIFAHIHLNRRNHHLEQGLLPESQCGFRRHSGTTEIIFAACPLQGKCQEMLAHLYSTFVELTKTFDTLVRQLHDGMMTRVTGNGAVSEAFAVTNRVKQDCVLVPTLFSLMFPAMLIDAYRSERLGIRVAYRADGRLLNQRRAHIQSRVSATSLHELLFVVDCVLNAASEGDMQRSMDILAVSCNYFDLVINYQKQDGA
ncbi:hypothetical protein SprV_0501891900 [Sparganum proliferum]